MNKSVLIVADILDHIKKVKIFLILLIPLVVGWLNSCREEKAPPRQQRLIFNCDGTDLLGNYMFGLRPLTVADVNEYVDWYAGTQVSTFMLCTGYNNLLYRSAYAGILGEDPSVSDTTQILYKISNDDPDFLRMFYRNFLKVERESGGADFIEVALKRAKEKKMETFITNRMNDLHFNFLDGPYKKPSLGYSDFWAKHPEYWLHENISRSAEIFGAGFLDVADGAFDFAHAEVRELKLGIITEQIDKYGHLSDGFDLDFMRHPVYFKKAESVKNAPLMTELLKAVRAKIDKASACEGRKILLSVRVPVSMDFCRDKGLDIKEWVRLGLVDFVTIGVFHYGYLTMPVAKFRSDLGNAFVPVYATIDDGGFWPHEPYTHGQRRGAASHIYAQGGDGIYLFNYFTYDDWDRNKFAPGCWAAKERTRSLLYELGSPETLCRRNKTFTPGDGSAEAYGMKPESPFPLAVSTGQPSEAEIFAGDPVRKDTPEEAILFIRTDRPAMFRLYVNGTEATLQKPEYPALFGRDTNLKNPQAIYAMTVPVAALTEGNNRIAIVSTGGTFKVMRMELALKYGPVEEAGFF
jgi:hypothetical protein